MLKNIFKIIVIFVLGIGGGIFADQILWPYFIERPLFYEYRLERAPIYITERNEIIIQENTALRDAIEKVERAAVAVRTKTSNGETLTGSGLIVSSDGLIITLAELVPKGANFVFFVDGKVPKYQILKRDLKENLALIKIEETNLATVGFADFDKLRLGEKVFLLGAVLETKGLQKIVNQGIVKTFDGESIETNIFEEYKLKGSPLFDIKGELVGISTIDSQGKVRAIPVTKIREFCGF